MGNWKDDKDLGPWPFTEQPDKWGYLNNPRWSNHPKAAADPMSASEFCEEKGISLDSIHTHKPCGHWHKKREVTVILTTEILWQQSLDVLKDSQLLGIGGMAEDSEREYLLYITDMDGNIQAATKFETVGNVSGYPGTILIENVGGTPTVFYHNTAEDAEGYNEYYIYKLNANGVSSRVRVSCEYYVDGYDYMFYNYYYIPKSLSMSSDGTLIAIEAVYLYDGGTVYRINTYKSTDYGSSWGSAIDITITDGFRYKPSIDCDSDGNFYIVVSDYTSPQKPFRMWKSSDGGDSWNEINTVPSTPILYALYLTMTISGTKIYVIGTVYLGSGNYETYIWVSSDSGGTWSATQITISGATYFFELNATSNGDIVVLVGEYSSYSYILRSDDAGATWVKIGQKDPALDWPTYIERYEHYSSINNDDDWFTFTACGDYISGTNHLGCLFSENDGLTWEAKVLPLSRILGVPSYGVAGDPDEPQVWPM